MAYNYYQTHKEELKAKMKEYQQTHKEQHNQTCKKYRENNKQKVAQSNRKWREKNQERFEQNNKRFYQNNPDYNKNYYQAHKEEILAKQKQYREENKKEIQAAREAIKKEKMEPFNKLAQSFEHVPVRGYEKEYEVFANGSVWSWKQLLFLKKQVNNKGRIYVSLTHKNKSIPILINRIVASSFDDRTVEELKDLETHHLDLDVNLNTIQNLVFLTKKFHLQMHKKLTNEQILFIGQQVKNLRGSAKTNKFVELVRGVFV